jgi:hypothetical protein
MISNMMLETIPVILAAAGWCLRLEAKTASTEKDVASVKALSMVYHTELKSQLDRIEARLDRVIEGR